MRTAVFGAALRVAGAFAGGAAFAAFFWGSQVLLSACHVASAREARVPQFQAPFALALLAQQTLPTLRCLPLVPALALLALFALLALRGRGARRFQD